MRLTELSKNQKKYDNLVFDISYLIVTNENGKNDNEIKKLKEKLLNDYGVEYDKLFD